MYGMWRALSRRHVHGLRFQPPATGGIHRIGGGVAQEAADAQSRHAAPRVAFVPLLKPRLHVTLHPFAVIAHHENGSGEAQQQQQQLLCCHERHKR